MMEWVIAALVATGTLFSLLAAIGIVRMPDLYTRVQVVTKASTLGTSCLAVAAALSFEETEAFVRLMLVVAFLFLTAPVSAHMIGRAAQATNVPTWEGTKRDERRDPPPRSGPAGDETGVSDDPAGNHGKPGSNHGKPGSSHDANGD